MNFNRLLFAAIVALVTLIVILIGATSTNAQYVPPCPEIGGVTLVKVEYVTRLKVKCVYAGEWDVFMGYPGYSPFFFCHVNRPANYSVKKAVENKAGNVKCVWIYGSTEEPEQRTAPAGFRGTN